MAQNECGLQVGTTPVDCDQASYPGGVTYNTVGDLFIDFTASPTTEVEAGGIDLSATGTDSITFDSATTNTELESRETIGALLSVTTVDGNIDIDTEELDADGQTPDGVTHGIFAESTGTGSIDITTTGRVDVQSGTNPADSIGIEAITASGDIVLTSATFLSGNGLGIRVDSGGAADLTLSGGSVSGGIDATAAGLLTIDVPDSGSAFNSIQGGIRADAGDMLINVGFERTIGGVPTALDLTTDGVITINNEGAISGTGFSSVPGDFAVQVSGGGSIVINNTTDPANLAALTLQKVLDLQNGINSLDGLIQGQLDFTGLAGGYTFNNNGIWSVRRIGSRSADFSQLGAGTFNNAGMIDFSDGESAVFAQGTTFNGTPGLSLIKMNITLNTDGQDSCENPTVAGCLDLSGGATTGETGIVVISSAPPLDPEGGLTGAANPGVLLVDVGGGTSAAEHFVLHPASENYGESALYGDVITTGGPLVYDLLYNPDTQQHILSSVPTEEGIEYATFIDETLSIWHTTADAVVGRQADLRGGATGGGWARLVSERTTRDVAPAFSVHGNDFAFDMSYEQETRAALFGFDAMTGENHVIGVYGGLISSETEYDGTGNKNETKGAAAGVYGGWWQDVGVGQVTVDATVNGNFLNLDHDASFEVTHSNVKSLGVRAEAGWRYPVIGGFYVQPLMTAAYVRSNIQRMKLRRNKLSFQNEESQRAALGLRLGGHFEVENGITARYWLTGRAWEEYVGDGQVAYATTAGEPLTIADDLSGSFEEVGFGASLSNKEDTLGVFASGGTKFIDDVTNYNVTVGLRKRW